MLYQYRITKYDPSRRNISGAYLDDDWTSRSDIGREFGGVELTQRRYLEVEQAYIDVASAFLQEAHIQCLRVKGLENQTPSATVPMEGCEVAASAVSPVLRGLLREEFWCKLESPIAFIHVGWDFYMYIGVPSRCEDTEEFARKAGLFPEVFSSPYFSNEA